jgi:hypothetical protein
MRPRFASFYSVDVSSVIGFVVEEINLMCGMARVLNAELVFLVLISGTLTGLNHLFRLDHSGAHGHNSREPPVGHSPYERAARNLSLLSHQ